MRSFIALLVALFLAIAQADVYLHSPRGANDRCDEKSNNRNNDQRLFDSENNAAGGYGVADQELAFYEDTVMRIEWYSQHNCGNGAQVKDDPGNPEGVNCNHVLQLGCENNFAAYSESMPAAQIAKNIPYALTDGVSLGRPGADAANTLNNGNQEDVFNTFGDTCTQRRTTTADCANGNGNQGNCATLNLADGGNRNTFNGGDCQCSARKTLTYALHEPEAYWLKAKLRERNKGLFTADQNVNNNNGALRTRQEPNSARYGFEVVEERDYWPYWHPSPWMDLAVMTSDLKQCTFFRSESQNQKNKCECLDPADATNTAAMKFNQEATCTAAGFKFVCSGAFDWTLPDCLLAPSQPDNSLARTDIKGDNSQQTDGARLAHYDWAIPTGKSSIIPAGQTETRCTIRLRYNISNAEVAADFDVQDNGKLKGNPVQTFGLGNVAAKVNETIPLRMAVNTAQFGRVFQDRTYVFTVKQRPAELQGKTIHNVNVRGKRGNIAQVRNCFEYDFNPLILNAEVGDIVHFQWALTDYNDNNNAGEGRAGTDRVNVVPVSQYTKNLPQVLNLTDTIFASDDLKTLAWLRQDPALCFNTQDMLGNQKNNQNDPKSCHFLNGVRAAPQPLSPKPNNQVRNGLLPTSSFNYMSKIVKNGSFQYMSSRNNNFSNRSQKAVINVGKKAIGSGGGSGTNGMGVGDGATNTPLGGTNLSVGALAGIVVGSVAGAAVIGGLAFVAIKKGGLSFSSRV